MEGHHWRRSLKTRVVLAGLVAGGLGIGALGVSKGGPIPFAGKNVSTVASDRYSAAVTDSVNGLQAVAIGPSNRLYTYWNTDNDGLWHGPFQIGAPGSAFSGPSINAEDDVTGSNLNLDVAVEGPSHSLLFYWYIQSSATWYGPLQVGAPGSTYSAPSVTFDQAGHVDVTAQGPNGSLWFYWAIGGSWSGPLQVAGPGSTFSTPSMNSDDASDCTASGVHIACLGISVLGPFGQNVQYYERGGTWLAPITSGQNEEFSAPAGWSSSGFWKSEFVGPSNSLIRETAFRTGGTNEYCVNGPAGTAFSAPTTIMDEAANGGVGMSGATNLGVLGPSHSLYVFWDTGPSAPNLGACYSFYGPLQLGAPNTAFSVPAMDADFPAPSTAVTNMMVEGPSHTLWDYYSTNGSWYGPMQIGGPGSTFDSNS